MSATCLNAHTCLLNSKFQFLRMIKCYETQENATCIQEINYEIRKYIPFDFPDVNCHWNFSHEDNEKKNLMSDEILRLQWFKHMIIVGIVILMR